MYFFLSLSAAYSLNCLKIKFYVFAHFLLTTGEVVWYSNHLEPEERVSWISFLIEYVLFQYRLLPLLYTFSFNTIAEISLYY